LKWSSTNSRIAEDRLPCWPLGVDLANQIGQRHAALTGNLLHAIPECLFEAHASLVAGDRSELKHAAQPENTTIIAMEHG
jgi:hypothetical protein